MKIVIIVLVGIAVMTVIGLTIHSFMLYKVAEHLEDIIGIYETRKQLKREIISSSICIVLYVLVIFMLV